MSDEPRLRPDADIGAALIAIGRTMLAPAPLEAASDAAAIHDFRRAMKRWRAFLRLLEPLLGNEAVRLQHEARDLARAQAGARDAQAALDALDDLGEDYAALSPASMRRLRARIEALRARAESESLPAEARDELRAKLARTRDAVEQWSLQGATFAAIAASLAQGYRRARRALPADWSAVRPEDLHALRQRVVVHRYQMELAAPLWPRLGRVWVGEAQRLRERLGKHQDLAVLAGLTAPKAPLARWRARILPAIEARQRDHIEAAMRLSARLFAEKPGAFRRRLEALWANRAGPA